MSDPFPFPSTTPNLGLPLLVSGQAQKEFFVNKALSVIDALDRRTVNASQTNPPTNPSEGDCYRVTATATQQWTGFEDHIAVRVAGAWHFVPPREGMRLFDAAADRCLFFQSGWRTATNPTVPTTGSVIDSEARATLTQLLQVLRDIGILNGASS